MKKEYEVKSTSNGFIIRFGHRENSYREENMSVAPSLKAVIRLIHDDLRSLETDLKEAA
jgi:hypothetical protein